jgi:protein SCO1/2
VRLGLAIAIAFVSAYATAAHAQNPKPVVPRFVDVSAHLGGWLDRSGTFEDARGAQRSLREFFDGRRPVLLSFNYFTCRALCDRQLRGLARGLTNVPWVAGKQFRLITVSIDPRETRDALRAKASELRGALRSAQEWVLLRGEQAQVSALARSAGFTYQYDQTRDQYAHAPLLVVLSGDGRITRYLSGVEYSSRDLRLALIEAARGKVGSPIEAILLSCFEYDALTGRYTFAVLTVMRATGVLTAAGLLAFALGHERRRRRQAASAPRETKPLRVVR